MARFHVSALPALVAALMLAAATGDRRDARADNAADGRALAAIAFEGPVRATVRRVVDGDTIEVEALIWLQQSLIIRVRIDGVDAPEMEARCPAERVRAEAARDFLERRIGGAEVLLTQVAYDKYGGRVRASVSDARGDIAAALLENGLARPYHGGRRQPWCAPA